eukprot:1137222-Pelagomonas_calceolata.AAC.16
MPTAVCENAGGLQCGHLKRIDGPALGLSSTVKQTASLSNGSGGECPDQLTVRMYGHCSDKTRLEHMPVSLQRWRGRGCVLPWKAYQL